MSPSYSFSVHSVLLGCFPPEILYISWGDGSLSAAIGPNSLQLLCSSFRGQTETTSPEAKTLIIDRHLRQKHFQHMRMSLSVYFVSM